MKSYFTSLLILLSSFAFCQDFNPNYDESKIPDYELPKLLVAKDGSKVSSEKQWSRTRRNEILCDFETYVYGKIPNGKIEISVQNVKEFDAFEGKATMREVKMTFSGNNRVIAMDILMYLPKSKAKVPLFLGLNFYGNQTIINDPHISLASSWTRNSKNCFITEHKATEESRGKRYYRWPIEMILDRGYGIATMHCGDIDPDRDSFSDGIHELFYGPDQSRPEKDEWGTIAAWAWGLSRAMDYLETDIDIDASKIVLHGHSRLGKTSLWAGALDKRFAIVISNDSGCGGAALSRRRFGETVWRINTSFPHWFNDNFNEFNNKEGALPVDQHMLIALIAPRPVYVSSAEDDNWADPKGEFLSAYHAGKVYELFGLNGLPNDEMPQVNHPIQKSVGYHVRTGGHDVKDFDWESWMDFADTHFGR